MTSSLPNDTYITAKLPPSVRDTLQEAADRTGTTLDQFIVRAAMREAQAIISGEHRIYLSAEGADKVFNLIENPPPPNEKLKEAFELHKAFFSEQD